MVLLMHTQTDPLAALVPGLRNRKHGFLMGIGLYSFLSYHVGIYDTGKAAVRLSGLAADDTFHTARTRSWIYIPCHLDGIAVAKACIQRLQAIGSGVLECISIVHVRYPPNIWHDYPDADRAAEKSIGKLFRQSPSICPVGERNFSSIECCFAHRNSGRIDFDTSVPSLIQSEVRHGARPGIDIPAAHFD